MTLLSRFLAPRVEPDPAGFEQLVASRGGRWYQACLRITADVGWAEDAVQEALLKAWHGRDRFRGEAELDTWIHRIAVNAALDRMRRERLRTGGGSLDSATDDLAQPLVPALALASDLGNALAALTELERVCFVLKHLEQWRLEDIAEQLESSIGSVKQALFRALRKLRTQLEDWRP